jgi:hypothetical protein
MGKGKKWSPEEEEFLLECVEAGKDEFKISEEFHIRTKMNVKGYHKRSPAAIKRRVHDLPVDMSVDESKPVNHNKAWSEEDDRLLLLNKNRGLKNNELAVMFDRTEKAIESRLQILKNKESAFAVIFKGLSDLAMTVNKFFFSSKGGGK